ncbi:diacylglycerol kinase eta isoform X2 [Cimex lectularius]|uniref:Diacylglycerol kinase n=1 Tax=Cimex lectularius TaxID=79782 RepID=A0A8I6S0A9_CIMLE|nr:diacylglycerol kinase eta isoform X2 [Cimex lectularius]
MEEWITALKETISTRERLWSGTATELHDLLSGRHRWQATSHARPTYCNICKDTLSGVTSHGLSCEICKWKVHKRCASKVINNCKWTTLASVGKEIIEDKDGNIYMPHQWMEGNLPVASKCAVCEKTCGSVLRLLDWRCLWCKSTVHTACRPNFPVQCNLGPSKVSVVPPTALHSVGSDDAWEAVRPQGCSPLLVFVNSKSGDNQGVKFLKRFKQLLNPAQVFDLMASGPQLGLQLFKRFDPFRVLVCSGDGSVGWVLSEIDKLNITKQCQVGVLPLGTGNDLARVLGWGASCDDDTNLAHILDKYEKATTKILDRWSIMTFERSISVSNEERIHLDSTLPAMADYENSVVSHLSNILESEDHSSILSSAKVLCETVKDFIMRAGEISLSQGDDELNLKCTVLREKLDQMLNSLLEEGLELDEEKLEKYTTEKAEKDNEIMEERGRSKLPTQEHLKMRANSLKRAVRQLIEHSERIVDEQNMARSSGNHQDSLIREKSENTLLEPIGRTEFLSISPLPTIRRDSNCSTSDITLENLPVPTEFADSRRPSASRISSPVVPDAYDSSERIQVVVNIEQQKDPDPEEAVTRVAEIDESNQDNENEGILSGLKLAEELANICHIDSSETSDESPEGTNELQNKDTRGFSINSKNSLKKKHQSIQFKSGSYETVDATNLISTSPDEEDDYDDFNRELGIDNTKKCSIAHFIEGNDIARRSIKCRHKKLQSLDDLELCESSKPDSDIYLQIPTIQISHSDNDSSQQEKLKGKEDKPSTFLDVVQFQIQGSNTNLRGSTDGMYLTDFQESHRKSLALSETDDEELVRFHRFASRGSVQSQIQPPQVIVDPPSPTGEDTPTRRFSYDCCRKLSAASPCSLMKPDSPDTGKAVPEKRLPIINPLVRLPTWPNISGSGIVGKVLLANADALCAAAVPLMDPLETLSEGFREKCVMNNYFGIGIDAKISLDFHQKREEHPEKCRSRAKNYMWYGVLGSKEWLQKTYKNLEQRVQLECDGQRIPLPSLQGIVILNIPSFMGGTNFWGGTKEGEVFLAPSVDDQILEVVAVFGSVQMAASRLINLQHHRIAQCHTVQINITGDEGVPVQVDGEAWIQPPGMIRIIHKNKMRMLCRNRALETSLKSWQEKQKQSKIRPSHSLSQSEMQILLSFIEATTTLVKCVKLLIIRHPSIEAEIYDLADRTSSNLEKVHPSGKIQQGPELRVLLTSLVSSARELHEEACMLLKEKAQSLKLAPELESQLNYALTSMENELRKCHVSESGQALVYLHQLSDQERKSKSGKLSWLKFRREKCDKGDIPKGMSREVSSWGVQEVGAWLDSIQLGEYAEAFARHDVRGREVITLTRRDLRDLGVTKVGHVKRLLHAVKELQSSA